MGDRREQAERKFARNRLIIRHDNFRYGGDSALDQPEWAANTNGNRAHGMRKPAQTSRLTPRLKPYTGVGEGFAARNAGMIAAVAAVILCVPYGFSYAVFTPWLLVPLIVPIAIMVVLIVWALPDVFSPPDELMEKMFFAFLFAFLLWPNYLAIDLDGLPWITLIRLIGTPLALLMLVCVSASPQFRKTMSEVLAETPLIWKFLVIYIALQALSLPLSRHPGDSIGEFVISQTTQTAIFFACCYAFRNPGLAEKWANILWVTSMLIAVIAVIEFFRKKVLWAGHVPQFLHVRDEVVAKILAGSVRETTGQYRAQGVFTTSLGLSEYVSFVMPFVIHFAASSHIKPLIRIMAGLSVPILITIILLTDSRLGLMGTFVGSMLYLLFWSTKQLRKNKVSLIPPALIVAFPAVVAAFIVASLTVGRIKAKVWGTGQYNSSNEYRMDQLRQGFPMVVRAPVGHGTGTAGEVLGFTNEAGELTIDNYWLAVALDSGILGLLFFVLLFATAGFIAAKYTLSKTDHGPEIELLQPLSITCFVFLFIKTVFAQDDNHPLLYMVIGIICALVYRIRQKERETNASQLAAGSR